MYTQLFEVLPEVAMKETRTVTAFPGNELGLPPGEYGLVESYCDDKDCDCQRVLLAVVSSVTQAPVAFIYYGWETLSFYNKWFNRGKNVNFADMSAIDQRAVRYMHGVNLSEDHEQSELAPVLLELISKQTLQDKVYVDRLKRHYTQFRAKAVKGSQRNILPFQRRPKK